MLMLRDRFALLAGLLGLAGFVVKADAVSYTFTYTFSDSAFISSDRDFSSGLQVIGGFEGTPNADGTITNLSAAWFEVDGERRSDLQVYEWSELDFDYRPGGIASTDFGKVNFSFVEAIGDPWGAGWGFEVVQSAEGLIAPWVLAFDYYWPDFQQVIAVDQEAFGVWTLTSASSVPDSASTLLLSALGLGLLGAYQRRRFGRSV